MINCNIVILRVVDISSISTKYCSRICLSDLREKPIKWVWVNDQFIGRIDPVSHHLAETSRSDQ